MAGRQRTTFQKRQREVKRLEKQKMKAEKRTARRQERAQKRAPAAEIPPPLPGPNLDRA
jgi:hypothetical protein